MLRFVEFHYANSLYLYRQTDKYGERISATATTIYYSCGIWLFALSVVERFFGSLTPLWRHWVPVIYRPGFAEFLAFGVLSISLNYVWLWRRTPLLEKRYAALRTKYQRWLAPVGALLGVAFALACGYGLLNFWGSLIIASSILVAQELFYLALKRTMLEGN